MAETTGQTPAMTSQQMREQRLQRNLKIVIVGMGVLILAALAAIAVKILSGGVKTSDAPAVTAISTPSGAVAVEIPAGARVVSTSLSGGQLAIHYEGPAGTGVAIVDLATGRKVLDVTPIQAVPRN